MFLAFVSANKKWIFKDCSYIVHSQFSKQTDPTIHVQLCLSAGT
jgi:hypothetical protein